MRHVILVAFSTLILHGCALTQSDTSAFKVEVKSALVWGIDASADAKSWSVKDPLTGAEMRKLSHDGVEVSSRVGFEKLHPYDAGELIAFTTTIANNTRMQLSVEAGKIAVDGHMASLLPVIPSPKSKRGEFNKGRGIVAIGNLHCSTSGFLSSENLFTRIGPPPPLVVAPGHSVSVSGVIQDPRHYPMLCSVSGCFPKGSIRYAVRIGGQEYIFIWPGRSMMNCGSVNVPD